MSVTLSMTIAELLGNAVVKRIGTKKTFIYSYCICLSATSLIYIAQTSMAEKKVLVVMPALLIASAFGVMTIFMLCYTATFELFPLKLRGDAMKWCNIVSRGLTIFAPMCAEIPDPGPIKITLVFMLISFFFAT